jgi:hypothetical protein
MGRIVYLLRKLLPSAVFSMMRRYGTAFLTPVRS